MAVKQETEKYELMLIIKSSLSEEQRGVAQQTLADTITKVGGSITSTDAWGKRHLAFKIENNYEGYYIVYKLDLPSAKVAELRDALKLNSDVVRYLVIKED